MVGKSILLGREEQVEHLGKKSGQNLLKHLRHAARANNMKAQSYLHQLVFEQLDEREAQQAWAICQERKRRKKDCE